jgi:hypothetical protein
VPGLDAIAAIAASLARVETKLDSALGEHGRRIDAHDARLSALEEGRRNLEAAVSGLSASRPRPVWPAVSAVAAVIAVAFTLVVALIPR